MRLPGTRYQEHGWEQVRKLLGQCSLQALAPVPPTLDAYVEAMAVQLRSAARSGRATMAGNSYGESVYELATGLLFELQARPGDWEAFIHAIDPADGEPLLRKKVNDMYAVLRDKVDADNYQVACGRACSANKIYTYRMLDMAYAELARLFANWQANAAQVSAILGRALEATPIEVRQLNTIANCRAEWIVRWSETLEQFGGSPGPLHTKSKRFASLKNGLDKIDDMLAEIGDYEELSSNRDTEWLQDEAQLDFWRVALGDDDLSPAPRLERAAILDGVSLPVKQAVFLKLMGPADDSYPDTWLAAGTGELPTMAQLAELEQVSLPTLRKRRDDAIASLPGIAR
ncbi:MAG: hypothetical protein V4463_03290 [Pseudomonadota bacterium]